jgi:hypothetical protein
LLDYFFIFNIFYFNYFIFNFVGLWAVHRELGWGVPWWPGKAILFFPFKKMGNTIQLSDFLLCNPFFEMYCSKITRVNYTSNPN